MKRLGLVVTLVAVLALPGAALAKQGADKGGRGPAPGACVQLRAKLGVANFRAAFAAGHKARSAFRKCVRDQRLVTKRMHKLAQQQCRTEAGEDHGKEAGEDPGDESEPGDEGDESGDESGEDSGDELDATGGPDKSLADCVAQKLKRLAQAHNKRYANAARTCKSRLVARKGRIARRGNAFGRCVRALVRAGDDGREGEKSEPGEDEQGEDAGEEPGDDEVADEPSDEVEE